MASFLASPGRIQWPQLAAAFIVGLRPADLRPKEGGRCCIHRRADAGRIETKRGCFEAVRRAVPGRIRGGATLLAG
jgi:hypothetical protein